MKICFNIKTWLYLIERHYRWAVKESAYKALYPHAHLQWKLVSFLPPPASTINGSNKPTLVLDSSLGLSSTLKLHASISHDGEYVFATVLAETLS